MKLLGAHLRSDGFLAFIFAVLFICATGQFANANPYLAKPGEATAKIRVGTCAVTRPGDFTYRLGSAVLKRFNLTET